MIEGRIRNVLAYDCASGALTWLETLSNRAPAGSPAGNMTNGYREVSVDDVSYRATSIIWVILFGRFPNHFIDHRDGDPANDRLSNLREATPAQNARNVRRHRDNRSGLKGVSIHPDMGRKRRWAARIRVNGRNKTIGYFLTKEEAHAAYMAEAEKHFGEFARAA